MQSYYDQHDERVCLNGKLGSKDNVVCRPDTINVSEMALERLSSQIY